MPDPTPQLESTSDTILRNLLEHSRDLVFFKDRQGRFLAINDALAQAHGLKDASKAVGKSDFDFFSKEQATRFASDEQQIIETGKPLLAKEEYEVHQGGQAAWYSTSKYPLINAAGDVVGTFGISRDITENIESLEALKDRENRLLEYRKRTEFELEQASRIHSALLPDALKAPAGLQFDFDYRPASSIGGDFFASYESPYAEATGLFICDIMGHGVSAALFTALISSLVESKTEEFLNRPDELLKGVNQGMLRQMPGSYATGLYTYIQREADDSVTLMIANAGHLCPLHYKASDRSVTRLARKKGIALGIMPENPIPVDFVELKQGDRVLFYTDGITEACDAEDEEYGRERLIQLIETTGEIEPQELIARINADVESYAADIAQADDRMLIILSM